MKKFRIYGIISASVVLGEYDADTIDDAIEMAELDSNANWNPTLCHQCAHEVEIGDVLDIQVEEID